MESRVRQLQALLKTASVVESQGGDGSVSAGSTVTLRYDGDDEDEAQRYFVGSIEERRGDMPVVSPSAPLGKALLAKRAGDTVEYDAPGGSLKVTIVEVDG
jgi:transcription elongation factor GreA